MRGATHNDFKKEEEEDDDFFLGGGGGRSTGTLVTGMRGSFLLPVVLVCAHSLCNWSGLLKASVVLRIVSSICLYSIN